MVRLTAELHVLELPLLYLLPGSLSGRPRPGGSRSRRCFLDELAGAEGGSSRPQHQAIEKANTDHLWANSGIFGYVNYLVEKDRKFILETLLNGEFGLFFLSAWLALALPPELRLTPRFSHARPRPSRVQRIRLGRSRGRRRQEE